MSWRELWHWRHDERRSRGGCRRREEAGTI